MLAEELLFDEGPEEIISLSKIEITGNSREF